MNLYVLPEWISPSACDEIIARFPPLQSAAINLSPEQATVTKAVRSSRVGFLRPDGLRSDIFFRHLCTTLYRINDRYYHYELASTEPLQCAEYAVGEHYGWHLDLGPGEATRRKLSVVVQLSSPEDYDGGDLEVFGSPPVDRARGTLVVFPSYLQHRVTPVTRGLRRSLVAWAIGSVGFR